MKKNKQKNENNDNINIFDNEWMTLTLFCIIDFGKCKYLREIMYEKDIDELQHHAKYFCKWYKLNIQDFMIGK